MPTVSFEESLRGSICQIAAPRSYRNSRKQTNSWNLNHYRLAVISKHLFDG